MMKISNYQIHNILKGYSEHLRRRSQVDRKKNDNLQEEFDEIRIFSQRKQQAVIDQVISGIIERLSPITTAPKAVCRKRDRHAVKNTGKELKTDFVFNEVDRCGNRTTRTISVDNIDFFSQK
jgi:hypothetical protein